MDDAREKAKKAHPEELSWFDLYSELEAKVRALRFNVSEALAEYDAGHEVSETSLTPSHRYWCCSCHRWISERALSSHLCDPRLADKHNPFPQEPPDAD